MVLMARSEALWDVFRATGYIGAYLLYRQILTSEEEAGGKKTVTCRSRGVAGIY